jgi:chemotaxis protein MotB
LEFIIMAKGGGSWKVAYADFVTAMMAFFLVMWIGAQDQKIKQSIASYFIDPMGMSQKKMSTGSIAEKSTNGTVDKSATVEMSHGRTSHKPPNEETSPPTKAVNDWLANDPQAAKYWQEQAKRLREKAGQSREVQEKLSTVEEVASRWLARQLQDHFSGGLAQQRKDVYQDLLVHSLNEVNWRELAEDLLRRN